MTDDLDKQRALNHAAFDIAVDLTLLLELQKGVPRTKLGEVAAESVDALGADYERWIWRMERVDGLVHLSGKATYQEQVDEAIVWTTRFMTNLQDAAARAATREKRDPQP